jgi:type I restriction enzyme R subunit
MEICRSWLLNEKRKDDFEQPLVIEDLKTALRRVNSCYELTDADLDYVVTSLRTISTNIEGIRVFLDRFRNGFVVPLQKEGEERILRLFDLESGKNSYVVTRQFKVEGLKANIRADIVLLVNGIPLVLIECKSSTAEVTWADAYRQIKRYEREAPELFKYVQFSVATDGIETRYFPNSYKDENKDLLSIWKDPYPHNFETKDELRDTVYGLLSKEHILDLIENFTFIKKEKDKSTKIMTRYMQFRASNKIFQRVINSLTGKAKTKNGLIWHWQGSGKTYSMAFAAWKLYHSPDTKNPSIFVMVDRKKLEGQIEDDFSFIGVPIEKIDSIRELIETLRWGREGKRGIFLVTIEKFRPKEFNQLKKVGRKLEIERENVIVLADEVHRTQYGKFATMVRSIFKNSFVFGFTGTPLSKKERNTFRWFCPKDELYLDRYSMLDALEDGFTVALSYEAKLPNYHLKKEQLQDFLRFQEEEIRTLSSTEQKVLRRKINLTKAYVKQPHRLQEISDNISKHFKDMVEQTQLKALLVTIDRETCASYKKLLDQHLPTEYSEVIMTFSANDKPKIKGYYEKMRKKYGTTDVKDMHQTIIENFKTRTEPRILIVTDMLITGFDAPNLWTMYLDKPLREHRLLQAIARTNRPFQNKKFGLIVDYIGVLAELEKAFEKFEASDSKALRVVIRKLDKEKELFEKLLINALQLFKTVKRENTRQSLQSALNILIDLETAKRFEKTMKELMRSYEMLSGDPFLRPYLLDYSWLVKIYIAYYKRFRRKGVDEIKVDELSKKTIQLIQETIDVKEIDESYPTVAIDEEYIKLLKKLAPKTSGAAIDLFPPMLIEVRNHPNSPFFINLGKEIERVYEEFRTRKIETAKAVQKLLEFSGNIVEWKKEEKEIGKKKYPLYEAIKLVIPQIEKQKSKAFIANLLGQLTTRNLIFKGWQSQRDIRRKVRAETRLLLLKEFREHKNKLDDLTEGIFIALEGINT